MELLFNKANRVCVQCQEKYKPWYAAQQQCESCTRGTRPRRVAPLTPSHARELLDPAERWIASAVEEVESDAEQGQVGQRQDSAGMDPEPSVGTGFLVLPEFG